MRKNIANEVSKAYREAKIGHLNELDNEKYQSYIHLSNSLPNRGDIDAYN